MGALGLSALNLQVGAAEATKAQRPLEVLVLGGTGFIGPHQVEALLDRGHKVTIFNRGRKSGLFAGRVEELVGNRDARIDDGLAALKGGRPWNVVVDNSGYVPRHVKDSVALLADRCDQYLYISTPAVYEPVSYTHLTLPTIVRASVRGSSLPNQSTQYLPVLPDSRCELARDE